MKTVLFTFLAVALLSLYAQPGGAPGTGPGGPGKEKIEAMKVSFISNELNLSPEEAKAFWPVFNKYEDEKKAIRKGDDEPQPLDVMSDADVSKFIQNFLVNKQKELDLYKKYIPEFKKILPERKVAKLLILDGEFKKMLLKQAKAAGFQKGGNPAKGPGEAPPAWKGGE